MKVCVIGRGKVGRSLQHALIAAGVAAQLVRARRLALPRTRFDVFILTVPDASLRAVAAALAPHVSAGQVVLHTAGARGPDELEACRARGASVAGFHPLVSFANPRAPSLAGATLVAHGDPLALRRARQLAKHLCARCVARPVLGPAYHAAAALVANGSAALAHAGVAILVALGLPRRAAERALAGLLHTVASNVDSVGVPRALTGPVIRGDAATLRAHLAALAALDPELARTYASVQPVILACARAAGLDRAALRRLELALPRRAQRNM